jgi:16S rRNA (cytosine967-C5)-methyltransferase
LSNIRIFPPLVSAITHAINEIFGENRKADKVINGILKSNPKWGSRDRAFIAENTYFIVRNWRYINYLDGVLDYQANKDFDNIVKIGFYLNGLMPTNENFFKGFDENQILEKIKEAENSFGLKYSYADWMIDTIKTEIGDNWEKELIALNQQAEVYLRVNELKISKIDLKTLLNSKGVEVIDVPGVDSALKLVKRQNVFGLEEFRKGFFEVQDAGSQMIADFLDVKPEHRVIDACAGAGGKALHLATIMGNKGRIIALDIEEYNLLELKSRAKRNGIGNIEARLIESKTIKRQRESADRLLLDVPCSGLGVLRRNPDAKWKLKPEFLTEIKETQLSILNQYATMLKPGGKMVYATCSILPSENNLQVEKFLKENKGYKLLDEQFLSPANDGFDGFYMALIEKE